MLQAMQSLSRFMGQPAPAAVPFFTITPAGTLQAEGIPRGGFVMLKIPRGSNGEMKTEVYTAEHRFIRF
jgi:hypothetical protein